MRPSFAGFCVFERLRSAFSDDLRTLRAHSMYDPAIGMRRSVTALLCVGAEAFSVPCQPLCARETFSAVTNIRQAPVMLDGPTVDTVVGAGLLFCGAALGAGVIVFVEKQGERTNERGGMSDETRSH